MERGVVERPVLAKVGAFLISGALLGPASLSAASTPAPGISVAGMEVAAPAFLVNASIELPDVLPPLSSAAFGASAEDEPEGLPMAPPPEPLVLDGLVLASWYGPGFYGNRTACGQTFSQDIIGVAHRTLACGTKVRITSPSGVSVVVPVIDRGPFVAGRSLDLSSALKTAIGCSDLCRVRMVVVDR